MRDSEREQDGTQDRVGLRTAKRANFGCLAWGTFLTWPTARLRGELPHSALETDDTALADLQRTADLPAQDE